MSASNLPALLDLAFKEFKQLSAYELAGKNLTFSSLDLQVRRLAQGLLDNGVRCGDRIAIVLPTSFEAIIAFHACLRISAIAVMHDFSSSMSQLSRYFQDYEPECVITAESKLGTLAGIVGKGAPKTVVSVNTVEEPKDSNSLTDTLLELALAGPRTISRTVSSGKTLPASLNTKSLKWAKLLASAPLSSQHPYPQESDIATLVYQPSNPREVKGLVFTHSNLLALIAQNTKHLATTQAGAKNSQTVTFSLVPIHSVSALHDVLTTQLINGNKTVLFTSDELGLLEKAFKKHSPANLICDGAAIFEISKLLTNKKFEPLELKYISLPTRLEAGAQCEILVEHNQESLLKTLGNPKILTKNIAETGLATAAELAEIQIPGFRGKADTATQIRVVDLNSSGQILANNQVGRLMVRGPHVFHGYWKRDDATTEVLSADGWLLTSELAMIDDEGFLVMATTEEE